MEGGRAWAKAGGACVRKARNGCRSGLQWISTPISVKRYSTRRECKVCLQWMVFIKGLRGGMGDAKVMVLGSLDIAARLIAQVW